MKALKNDLYDWQTVKISSIIESSFSGGTPSTREKSYWDGDIPWTTTAIINESDIYLRKFQKKISDKGLKNSSSKIAPKGSILIGSRVGVGKAAVASFDVAINQDITVLVPNSKLLPEFFILLLKSNKYKKKFSDIKRGTTIKGITKKDVLNLEIFLPKLTEQKKIVEMLRAVQEAKEQTEEVIRAAKELKKSLMKHFFTYGPVPIEEAEKVKLKETEIGMTPEEWSEYPLINIATLQRGKDLPKQKQIFGPFPIVGSSGIIGFHNKAIQSGPGVVLGRSGSIGNLTYIENDFWPHNTGLYVKDFHGNNPKFIYYQLHLLNFKKYATGVSVPTLNRNFIHGLLLRIPPLELQEEITSLLSSVDKKIEAEENKKKALEELFKTLLNNLMTGKIRVYNLDIEI